MGHRCIEDFLRSASAKLQVCRDAPLAAHTWYRIGGPARYLVFPETGDACVDLLRACRETRTPWVVLGGGANVLVSDRGFPGLVCCTAGRMKEMARVDALTLRVGAGLSLAHLVRFCEAQGLGGVAGLAGIPGTVGGACCMNAGTDHGRIGDVVTQITVFDPALQRVRELSAQQVCFGYRHVPQLEGMVVLGCTLGLEHCDPAALGRIRTTLLQRRKRTQPLSRPSCGSVFKRPPGEYAGRLIEQAGLKGTRRGGAQISTLHANFIVNTGNARAEEVLALMRLARDRVYERTGITLEPEVRFIGFETHPFARCLN